MKVRRKGQLVDIDGEEEGTLVDEEEEVLEEAGVDGTPLTQEGSEYFEGQGEKRKGETEQEYMDRLERENPDAQAYRKAHGQPEPEEPDEFDFGHTKESLKAERAAEKEGKRIEKRAELKESLAIQKEKTELAQLRKQEVEAGGGGLRGLVKRSVKGVRQEVQKESGKKAGSKKGRKGYSGRYGRGQRRRAVAQTGLYSVSGMRQLTVPGRGRVNRGQRVSQIPIGGISPQGGGLSELRRLSTPSFHSNLRGEHLTAKVPKPMSFGVNMKGMEPMGLNIGTGKVKPMGLGIKPSKRKPMTLSIRTSGLKSTIGSRSIKSSTYLKSGIKPMRVKPMKVRIKRPKNKQYNRKMRELLKRERI